jgi:hypothetical protein
MFIDRSEYAFRTIAMPVLGRPSPRRRFCDTQSRRAVEFHVYNRGGHGFGMTGRAPAFAQLPVSGWPGRFQEWMVDMGFLPR